MPIDIYELDKVDPESAQAKEIAKSGNSHNFAASRTPSKTRFTSSNEL